MKFCKIKVSGPFFLAPMAAITNLPFRILCKKYGSGLGFTEMVNSTHISRKPEIIETLRELRTCKEEKPICLQLVGNDAKEFAAATRLLEKKFEMININAGCPATNETKLGSGAALLRKPEKIVEIVHAVKESTKKPVSVKIRLGWQKNNSPEICKLIEKAGADAIIVHARLAGQGYSGKADWSALAFLVKNSGIPIVVNGDIVDAKSAIDCLEKTRAEFAMIGRGAMQNPLVFKEISEFQKGKEWKASPAERLAVFEEYFGLCEKFGSADEANLKIIAMQFSKGSQGARQLREKIMKAKTSGEIRNAINEFGKKE